MLISYLTAVHSCEYVCEPSQAILLSSFCCILHPDFRLLLNLFTVFVIDTVPKGTGTKWLTSCGGAS